MIRKYLTSAACGLAVGLQLHTASAAQPALKEVVVAVSDIDRALAVFAAAPGWRVLDRSRADTTVARVLGLSVDTEIDQALVGAPESKDGSVRLIAIKGPAKEMPSPGGRQWNVTGLQGLTIPVADMTAWKRFITGVGLGDAGLFAGWRFTQAKAADVSNQILFGVLALRVMVPDAAAFAARAATAGVTVTAAPQIERLAPYGILRTTTVTAPGGMLVEAMSTGAAPMTEAELKSRFAQGGSATWVRFNNKLTGRVQWRADGTAHVVWDTGNLDEQGTWTIKGDAVCTAWTRLRFNRELCVHHFALDRNTTQSFRVDSLLPDGIYSWK